MSDFVPEPERSVPVVDHADVVVLGGGPAGVAAAVAAGRAGADVLLVERYGCLGGLATGGLVIVLTSYGPKGEVLMSGLAAEFLDRLRARDALRTPEWFHDESPLCDPEVLKAICFQMVEEAGVRLLLHSWIAGAVVEEGRLQAAVIESKSGRQAIRGKVFVDCTGDGDTAAWAGVPHENSVSPLGLGLDWRWGNVDMPRFRQWRRERPDEVKALHERMKHEGVHWAPNDDVRDDRTWFLTYFPGDALSVRDLTHCEIEMRKLALRSYDFYRANVPGFENASILDTASQVGTRESRRILGGYVMRGEDVPGGKFPDSIGTGVTWTGPRASQPFDFPYRALVPQRVENLLFAGRCISADHVAHQNTRVIPNCWVTGQAAGGAAALAVRRGCPVGEVPVAELQALLRRQGVRVG